MQSPTDLDNTANATVGACGSNGEILPEWMEAALAADARGETPIQPVPAIKRSPAAGQPASESPVIATAANAKVSSFGGNGEVLPEWMETGLAHHARSENTAKSSAPPSIPEAPPPPPDRIASAIQDLINLLPGKPAAIGLENGLFGIVMCLDAETQKLTVPFLSEHCGYQPYTPPPVEDGPPLDAHILIVDDAYISRLVLRRVIEQLPGCTVTEAETGAEALAILQNGMSPDLIVCDICMPDMDGLQLLTHIRTTPFLRDLEVVMCTSTTDRESVTRAAELNVNKFFVKPFKPDEVRAKLREILSQSSMRTNEMVADLKDRLGLSPSACGELFHQLSESVREEVKTARNELGAGKNHSATKTLQRLRGSCVLIKDNNLVARVQSVINATARNDMFDIVKGMEVLSAEGRRLAAVAHKLRKHREPESKPLDPMAAAASRMKV
jgi:CheY-like chemotaxis protein